MGLVIHVPIASLCGCQPLPSRITASSAPVRFSRGHLTDIAIRRRRPRNLGAMVFAATLCTPDSVGSKCGSLRSAPHRSPHAIAGLECEEDVPSDASRDVGCDVLTFR